MTLTRICICGLLVSLSQVSSVQQESSTQSTWRTPNATSSFNSSATKNEEDKYIEFFTTDPIPWRTPLDPIWSYGRNLVRVSKTLNAKGPTPLKAFCESAHFRGGFGMAVIYNAFMNASTLKFKNEKYTPMRIDVITYDIKDYGYFKDTDVESNRHYITQGLRPDCVYFLAPANINKTEYYLDMHICGLILPPQE